MKINWKIFAQIVLAVITLGWGWLADNQVIVIGFAASVLVWLFDFLTRQKVTVGKFWKTIAVFIVSVGLQLLFAPVGIPTFPGWEVPLLVDYIAQWFILAQDVMLAAMVIYNIMLDQVLGNTAVLLRAKVPALR